MRELLFVANLENKKKVHRNLVVYKKIATFAAEYANERFLLHIVELFLCELCLFIDNRFTAKV